MYDLSVLVIDCQVGLLGLDEVCFDQVFKAFLEAADLARTGRRDSSIFMAGSRAQGTGFKQVKKFWASKISECQRRIS
jgi:hypothetical protein